MRINSNDICYTNSPHFYQKRQFSTEIIDRSWQAGKQTILEERASARSSTAIRVFLKSIRAL